MPREPASTPKSQGSSPGPSQAPFQAPRHPRSLAASAHGADRFLGLFFLLVAALLVAGWILPIMTVRKLVFFAERVSILEGITELWETDNYLLFVVIVTFSVLFPAAKMLLALLLWYGADAKSPILLRALNLLEILSRWSMLDVFVIALTIVAIEISLINDVTTHAGLYVFTAAVVLSMAGLRRLTVLAQRAGGNGA